MKAARAFFLVIALIHFRGAGFALQAGTPEGALEEMVTTDKLETLASHLPVKTEEIINGLGVKEKEELSKKVLVKNLVASHGGSFRKAEDGGSWEVWNEKGELEGFIRLKNSFASGDEALVALEFSKKENATDEKPNQSNNRRSSVKQKDSPLVLVSMHLQEGAWRVTGFGPWEQQNLEEELLSGLLSDVKGESGTISTLRMLNGYLREYRTRYPEIGLPDNLAALSGPSGAPRSSAHAMLADPSFMMVPLIRSGYKFQYTMLDPGIGRNSEARYQITATPADLGKSRSFFTDQSGLIRATAEGRDANENDEPI